MLHLEEKKQDSNQDFEELIGLTPYTAQATVDFINARPQHKACWAKTKSAIQELKNAGLLTQENQAAVIAAREHAQTVENALEILDDAGFFITNQIRKALIQAGAKAEEYAKTLRTLSELQILDKKTKSETALLSLNFDELTLFNNTIDMARKNYIVGIDPREACDSHTVTRSLLLLIENGISPTDIICNLIAIANKTAIVLAQKLILLNVKQLLTDFILDLLEKSYKAIEFATLILDLEEEEIPHTDEILKTVSDHTHQYQKTGQALKLLKESGLTDPFLKRLNIHVDPLMIAQVLIRLHQKNIPVKKDNILNRIFDASFNTIKFADALILLKENGVELSDNLIHILACCSYYLEDLAQTILSLHIAKIPLTNFLAKRYLFGRYGIKQADEDGRQYFPPYVMPKSAKALIALSEKIEITDDIVTAVTQSEDHAEIVAQQILSLHENNIRLTPSLLKAITPIVEHFSTEQNSTLPDTLIALKKKHGKLLSDEIVEVAIKFKALPLLSDTLEHLLILKKKKMLSDRILEALGKKHHYHTIKIVNALIFLKKHKIQPTEEIILAIIEAGAYAGEMAEELVGYNSINLKLSDNVIMAIGKNAEALAPDAKHRTCALTTIRHAYMSLHFLFFKVGVLTDNSMINLAGVNHFAFTLVRQFLFLKDHGFPITDGRIEGAVCSFMGEPHTMANSLFRSDNQKNALIVRRIGNRPAGESSITRLPADIMEHIASFFCYPEGQIPIHPNADITRGMRLSSYDFSAMEYKYSKQEEKAPSMCLKRSLSMGTLPVNSEPVIKENKEEKHPEKKDSALVKYSLVAARQNVLHRSQSCHSFSSGKAPKL